MFDVRECWPKPAPPDFPRPLSGNDGQDLHRLTFSGQPSGDVGQDLNRLTFPGQLSGDVGQDLHRWTFPGQLSGGP